MSGPALAHDPLLSELLMQYSGQSPASSVNADFVTLTEQLYYLLCAGLLMASCLHTWQNLI